MVPRPPSRIVTTRAHPSRRRPVRVSVPAVLPQRSAAQCTQLTPHRFVRVYDIKTRALKSKTYLKQRLNTVLFAADGLARPTVRSDH
jgi:hypothetical protein